jgi:ferritin-like metal-binding protein YciE
MKLNKLHDLFILELQDLYDAEQQITQAIPQMLEFVHSDDLREALSSHLEETHGQIKKLENLAKDFDIDLSGKTCVGMEGIIEEAVELMQEATPGWTLDSALIGCAQKVEHYEIAGYGTAAAYAKQIQHDEALNTLLDILQEEKNSDQKLTNLAEGLINRQADQEMPRSPRAL